MCAEKRSGAPARRLRLGALLVAAAAALPGAPGARGAEPAGRIGAPAPALALADLDGKPLDLASLKGKVVVLDFFASWCVPCRAQVPKFVALQEKYRAKGLVVVGISLDDSADTARTFRQKTGMTYRAALGDAKLAERWGGIMGLPVAFVVDRKGVLFARHEGADDLPAVERDVAKLLGTK